MGSEAGGGGGGVSGASGFTGEGANSSKVLAVASLVSKILLDDLFIVEL